MVLNRSKARASLALAMVIASACGSEEGRKRDGDGGNSDPTDAAMNAPDASMADAAPLDAQADAAGDAASRDASNRDADARAPGVTPVITAAQARQVGRFGHDVRIDVTGSDADADGLAVRLELFDMNASIGSVDVPLSAPLGKSPSSKAFAVMPFYFRDHPQVKRATVSVLDDSGNISNTIEVNVEKQPVLPLSATCDTTYVENRCEDGLGCKGTLPSSCRAGEKATITRAGYYSDERGDRILMEGTDPDDDVNRYTIKFLDASGNPVSVDLDGELGDERPTSSTTVQVDPVASGGKFFFRFDPGTDFLDLVKKVELSVTDLANLTSPTVTKTLNDTDVSASSTGAPIRSTGQECDSRAFDRCVTGAVCTLATATATKTTCLALNTARSRACQAAMELNPFNGVTQVRGEIKEPSLWDAPDGCSTNNPKYRPEAVVRLKLTRPATKVVLSTSNPYTAFDTTVYAMADCASMPVDAWCADDQPATSAGGSNRAVLEITGNPLPAKDYYVVVDSFSNYGATGTTFQIDAIVTE